MKGYPKVLQIHHLKDFLGFDFKEAEWIVQEKVDGSQFKCYVNEDGTLDMASKNVLLVEKDNVLKEKSGFEIAINNLFNLKDKLQKYKGYTFYFEFMRDKKQNAITYGRAPKNNLILFDVRKDNLEFVEDMEQLKRIANDIGVEAVNILEENVKLDIDKLDKYLKKVSYLGKELMEGVVIKTYNHKRVKEPYFNEPVFAKWVRESFKELNNRRQKEYKKDFFDALIEEYKTEARWLKAIQHLRDEGKLELELRDLRFLGKEVIRDIMEEEGEIIKKKILDYYLKKFEKEITKGLPEFYKKWLIENKK